MRWPGIERVWLPEWLDDPDATADRLVAAVEAARIGERSVSAPTAERVEDPESLTTEEPVAPLREEMPKDRTTRMPSA